MWRGLTRGAPAGEFQGALFHLRVREHFQDGLAYGLSLILQPTVADWQFVTVPPGASFLYYALRPVRLAAKYGRRLLAPSWSSE